MKIKLNVAERKLKEQSEKITNSTSEMEASEKIIEYQEITELSSHLMKELIKRIIIYPNGSIRIEWNFCDEIGELCSINDILPTEIAV